ncbi:MAG: hypothetical protein ABEI27_03795 [Halobellus sp.]|uniref:hypothetical protein n=1 Tax=Halobellus sp. TaxID=1979212 RepID=UPI0035D449C0
MAAAIAGLAGGLVATAVMTIVMMVQGDGGPPTAGLVATFSDGDPEDYAMPGTLLYFTYGIVAAAAFAVGVPPVGPRLESVAVAAGLGVVYGVILMIGGMAFWMWRIIGMAPDREIMRTFGTAHVLYGLVLGLFLGAGVLA